MGVGADSEFGVEGLVGLAIVETGDPGLAGFEAGQHRRQIPVGGGAGDQRDEGGFFKDVFALLLGDTADDSELFALALEALVLVETVEDLLLGLIADRTGV